MTTSGFRPTHVVPRDGMPAWETPAPSRPTVPLDALLPVQLVDRRGDWGRVVCANGWSAWVDGRLLVAVPQGPPLAGGPPSGTADPRPLLARAEEALAHYRAAADDLVAGRLDGESFRERTRGLRIGVVVDGESLWLYDAVQERWAYCEGTRLSTYATTAEPSAARELSAEGRPTAAGEPSAAEGVTAAEEPPATREPSGTGEKSGTADAHGHEPTRHVPRPPGDR
ncbi:hypothetical protein AAW14_36805 [Streptomyces hygroscopicus]|uniref:hypothetical protein n=1 Tax=Streptomyces hygroscopicus TaxID=1912 RepID=UPI0022401EEA|nr:hypothetical protein [Streptomyces hygroscopicus]MCW7947355.1 hypothetical protein [Streptomyces hygroscopicus]